MIYWLISELKVISKTACCTCPVCHEARFASKPPSQIVPALADEDLYLCSESTMYRILKEERLQHTPLYHEKPFENIAAARQWVMQFVTWYNTEHRHSALKFVTPEEKHQRLDYDILKKRVQTYTNVQAQNPLRWAHQTRNWTPVDKVILNPATSVEKEKYIFFFCNLFRRQAYFTIYVPVKSILLFSYDHIRPIFINRIFQYSTCNINIIVFKPGFFRKEAYLIDI